MAKGARSNKKRNLHTWRRENLKADWMEKAEERRLAALQDVLAAPKPEIESKADMEEDAEAQRGRGRPGVAAGDVEMDGEQERSGGKKKKFSKGVKVAAGVHKKKRAGKAFLQGGNQFYRKGKKGSRRK